MRGKTRSLNRPEDRARGDAAPAERRARKEKRSGADAVKLHLETTHDRTGRTSRSATAARKTSIRMTAIKEYPFDLSDLKESNGGAATVMTAPVTPAPAPAPAPATAPASAAASTEQAADTKRKVSIVTDKDKGYDNHGYERSRKLSEGPAQRKSNNVLRSDFVDKNGPQPFTPRYKKYSSASSIQSKGNTTSAQDQALRSSWWYSCCKKFHKPDSGVPSWEPPKWQKMCPYPLCPTYRHFAQTLSLFIIGILTWIVVWCITGDLAEPGGVIFEITLLAILAHFGGWLMVKITTLPALIGMLLMGVALRNLGVVQLGKETTAMCSVIRKIALTIILTRAGLDLEPNAMKKLFFTVLKLGLVPWTAECGIVAVMTHFILGLPWVWAFLLGSVIAAVSPAVVVPCLFRLRQRGYGVAKGIPTLVLAVSGIDDAVSVAIFGIISGIMFSNSSLTMNIVQGPASVVLGVGLGSLCGYLVKYIPERNDGSLVPLRVLLLLCGGLVAVLGSEELGWGGAGPLAVISYSFMAMKNWAELGWELDDNPVATAFEIFWMLFEPLLFSITGAAVVFSELEADLVLLVAGCLITAFVCRIVITAGIGFGSNLNNKEKIFVAFSWMAKATVQAALTPVAINEVKKIVDLPEDSPLPRYAYIVQTVCVMSIILTAPLGAIIITLTGPRLLTKTTKPQIQEGWRRSHRPSMRDISIIDEEELGERAAAAAASSAPASGAATPERANIKSASAAMRSANSAV